MAAPAPAPASQSGSAGSLSTDTRELALNLFTIAQKSAPPRAIMAIEVLDFVALGMFTRPFLHSSLEQVRAFAEERLRRPRQWFEAKGGVEAVLDVLLPPKLPPDAMPCSREALRAQLLALLVSFD